MAGGNIHATNSYYEPLTTDVNNDESVIPANFSLEQNYPNPFNPETVIGYRLSNAGHVSLKVYDMLGRLVSVLVNEYKQSGSYKVSFNGQQTASHGQLTSGIYFYTLQAGSSIQTRKMILLQ